MQNLTNRVKDVVIVHLSKKRSLATFHAMFPLTVEQRQHKVEWHDFLLSMEDAGFAIRNGGGSIVIFDHLHSAGKVNIHRPHPETTIDSDHLQFTGQRLSLHFGWTRSSFLLVRL